MPPNDIVLVDTSAWICFFARKGFDAVKKAISLLLEENRVAITGPILVEMIQGCRTEEEKKNLKEVFAGIHRFPIAEVLWEDTADLSFALRRKGITVSAVDALIATVAINYDLRLLHHDSDYDLMAKYTELKIYQP